MEFKDYQLRTLDAFSRWLDFLADARNDTNQLRETLAGIDSELLSNAELFNYPKVAWNKLRDAGGVAASARDYVDRTDGADRPIPHVCFKVPTGGGKTLLAAAAIERLNRHTGLVLWIVPTRAIYQQTLDKLRDRQHPYRQRLEQASGGRVKLLQKEDLFTRLDVENYLCVMLLMLPATNRQKGKEFLRMFRDSGRYPTLFPDDDPLGETELLAEHPDLERTTDDGTVKRSLYNVFKMLRPVVVLDEAHKAYGKAAAEDEFVRSVNRLNPSLVLELSATPNARISNLLVDVSGVDLKAEEMIKLPVEVTSYANIEWQYTLAQAAEQLDNLDAEARSLEGTEGRYIRPIAVVRVDRTGKDQRDGERIHAEDAREYLIANLGVPANEIRVKSAENDELGREDLLSPYSPVRWIITKAALMEGWDCPFAYLLVMLDNTQAQRAITQLVGRVMRQPHARRTGRDALDRCYVVCCNTDVGTVVGQVKLGLETQGLTGLGDDVAGHAADEELRTIARRPEFRDREIFLPCVSHRSSTNPDEWIPLDYQAHILPEIDWDAIVATDIQSAFGDGPQRHTVWVDVGEAPIRSGPSEDLDIDKTVRLTFFTRRLSDVVPNPWQATRIAQTALNAMREQGKSDDDIFDQRSTLAFTLRERVKQARERQAENAFVRKYNEGDLAFDLDTSLPRYQVKETYEIAVRRGDSAFQRDFGEPLQISLFEPIYDREFDSELERGFARYLDEFRALNWWYRIAVRRRGEYYLRGWRPERIYPDFVAMAGETEDNPHLLVFETKGEHLKGNPETEYKQRVMHALEGAFNRVGLTIVNDNGGVSAGEPTREVGTVRVHDGPAAGVFKLIFREEDFDTALAGLREALQD